MTLDYSCRPLNPPSPSSNHPYNSCLSSSASSSSSSVFSVDGASSQTSEVSTSSTNSLNINWDAEDAWSTSGHSQQQVQSEQVCPRIPQPLARASTFPFYQRESAVQHVLPPLRSCDVVVPPEQRQHPRRSSTTLGLRCPPALVRQSERKVNFVDSLVDSATQMVELIWPLSVPTCPSETANGRNVLPLRTFIQETLRRSRTSYSTLQVALYYLVLIKAHVPTHDFTMEQPEDRQALRALQCGRRMFLAALILASKYLQDRNYSARAWSKISGLKVCEINTNEMAFLHAVGWKLHIVDSIWERWQAIVLKYTPVSHQPPSPGAAASEMSWKSVIPLLTPELEIAESLQAPHTPVRLTAGQEPRVGPRSPLAGTCSQESTPTPTHYRLPRFLEPKPDMLPPTPSLARLGSLPTPMLTPQSNGCITPAASVVNFGSRRPSMCSAMAQAQTASLARSAVDQWNPVCKPFGLEPYSMTGRRPSLAPSVASSTSSPESMVSDNSSRSSRASSISSVSSSTWAPAQTKLARLATCRSAARLRSSAMPSTKENYDIITSDPLSSPDLDSFHLDESDDVLSLTMNRPPTSAGNFYGRPQTASKVSPKGRKRCRSSVDMSLQQNVRQLLNDPSFQGQTTVLPDRSLAQSFLLDNSANANCEDAKALQSPKHTVTECRFPMPKDLGRKRTCCTSQVSSLAGNTWNSYNLTG